MKHYKVILKKLFSLAFPIIFSNIISISSGVINMVFISTINPSALASGAIITSTYGLVTVMAMSVLYSVSILIGQCHGASRNSDVGSIIFSGVAIAFVIGIPLVFIVLYMAHILQFLHQPPEVSKLAGQYFSGISYGLIPSLIVAVFTQFFMGISKAKLLLYFTILGALVNIILSYFLIFGLYTLKPLGVFGAGVSSSITAYILLIIILIYIFFNSELKKYNITSKNMFNLSYCKLLLKIGTPISIQYTLELFVFSIITYLMGFIGTNALGAHQITLQCSMVAIMVVMGFSQSGSILISQNLLEGRHNDRRIIANMTFIIGGVLMIGIGLFYCFWPNVLISLYLNINDPELSEIAALARIMLYISAFTQFFDAGRNIAAGLLRGYGDTKSSMWTSLISCWVIGLPLSIVFAFIFDFNAIGLKVGIMVGILFGCSYLVRKINKIYNNKADYSLEHYHAGVV